MRFLFFLIFWLVLPRRPVSVVSVRAARIRLKIERWQLVGGNKSWMGPLLMVCRRVQQSATFFIQFLLTSTRFFEFEDVHALLKLCCATILGTSALYTTVGWLCNTQNVHLVHRLHFPVWVIFVTPHLFPRHHNVHRSDGVVRVSLNLLTSIILRLLRSIYTE